MAKQQKTGTEPMDRNIEALMERYPKLCIQLNRGKRHKIWRPDLGRGSLWIIPRTDHYCVNPTGAVARRLSGFLQAHFGPPPHKDQPKGRWDYWDVNDLTDVAAIIQHLDRV
jgi:hypothetical protein